MKIQGFKTQEYINLLEQVSKEELHSSLKLILNSEELNKLFSPDRIVDLINFADSVFPHSHKQIHESSKKFLKEVKETVRQIKNLRIQQKVLSHYEMVSLGAGPLSSFYLEMISALKNIPLNSQSSLIVDHNKIKGTFNLDSDLHLLQPGFLREEVNQLYKLPLPSSLVKLGLLGQGTALTEVEKIEVNLLDEGLFKLSLDSQEVITPHLLLNLGLGEDRKTIVHESALSIFGIASNGGQELKNRLKEFRNKKVVLNLFGNGGAVSSCLHVLYRYINELNHEGLNLQCTINLFLGLGKTSLSHNEKLASHLAWSHNELINLKLLTSTLDFDYSKKIIKVGDIEVSHRSNEEVITGEMFNYDFSGCSATISESGKLEIYHQSLLIFSGENSLSINCAGQKNVFGLRLLSEIFQTAKMKKIIPQFEVFKDEEGAYALKIELDKGNLFIGTTQAIGILKALEEDPKDYSLLSEVVGYLKKLHSGHTECSGKRSLHAFYKIQKKDLLYEISGGLEFETIPNNVSFSIALDMPGAVGVCSNRELTIVNS